MADTTARAAAGSARDWPVARAAATAAWPAAAILTVQVLAFPVPLEVCLQGVVLGLLNAMVVQGLILVYRANRVVNFAQASIGTFPATLAGGIVLFGAPSAAMTGGVALVGGLVVVLGALTVARLSLTTSVLAGLVTMVVSAVGLQVAEELGWFGGLVVGIFAAVICGIGIDAIVIRRLRTSPRLVVAVATIGLAQFFAIIGLLTPRLWDAVALVDPEGDRTGFDVPGDFSVTIGSTIFGSSELVAVGLALLSIALISFALRRTDIGVAVRAAADSGDRASMLGVPVPRIEAGVWIVASVLAFVATYAQAGILGLELTAGVGLRVMVAALGAMAIGGFRSMPSMLLAAVAIGVLAQATGPAGGHSLTLTDAVLAGVVIVGLLLRRASNRRADRDTSSSWQATAEPRAIPFELVRLPALRLLRVLGVLALIGFAAALPLVMSESQVLRGSVVIALIVVVLSIVVLTGWTGEVTLGQMAFAASGAAVAAYTTLEWRFDPTLVLLLAGLAGALVATAVALPALRWQGVFLAVTTLAFSLAAVNYLLNPTIATWIPTEDIARRPLLGTFDLSSRTSMYELALAVAVLCLTGVAGIRRTRVGRVLRAVRDNKLSAQAFGIRVPLARISAFALSGFLAGIGGALLFLINERYEVAIFTTNESLSVFISAVVGGVGSLVGAVLGAVVLEGSRVFLSGPAALLPSAIGVLGVLLLLPGGLAEVVYRGRDNLLRSFANRRRIHVPSLVADRRVADPTPHLGPDGTDASPGDVDLRDGWPDGTAAPAHAPHEPGRPDATPFGGQEPFEPKPFGPRPGATGPGGPTPPGSMPVEPAAPAPVAHPALPAEPGWLSVRGLDVAYDKVQVLFDVDIDIPQGQITALLGTNGAGKSTLLKAIGGVVPVTAGTLRLGDVDLHRLRPEQVPAHGIVQMPGGHGVFPSLTVDENLRVAAWLFRKDRADANQRIVEARERFPILQQRREAQAADLSGGQQQQLALAMALLARPKLLLVDELSLGLAPVMVESLLGELRALREQGTTIVVVEQSVNVALSIADHAYFMEKGEIRFSGDADHLLDQPDLVRSVFLQGARDALSGNGTRARTAGRTKVGAGIAPTGGPPPPPALQVGDLTVSFGGITAVNNVSFSVAPREIVGLIGPNGAGKTTVVDLISGFTPTDSGLIMVHGVDVTSSPPSARARRGVGRSFQDARLFPGLTVAETIGVSLERWIDGDDMVAAAFRLPASRAVERDIAERTDELVELFGLQAFRSKRIGDLSTGSRRMVDLACVVAHKPSIVMLDEPTSGIAQREAEALGPVLLGLRDRLDATLLIIEHDIALISSVADRLVALDQGAVVTMGEPAKVLDHRDVVASYLGTGSDTLRRSDHALGGSR